MSNAIILPTEIQKIVPKPTKAQLVKALVEREKEKWEADREVYQEKRKEALEKLRDKMLPLVKHQLDNKERVEVDPYAVGRWNRSRNELSIKIEITVFPGDEEGDMILGIQKMDSANCRWFDEKEARRRITDGLSRLKGADVLSDERFKPALDQILEDITVRKARPSNTITV